MELCGTEELDSNLTVRKIWNIFNFIIGTFNEKHNTGQTRSHNVKKILLQKYILHSKCPLLFYSLYKPLTCPLSMTPYDVMAMLLCLARGTSVYRGSKVIERRSTDRIVDRWAGREMVTALESLSSLKLRFQSLKL